MPPGTFHEDQSTTKSGREREHPPPRGYPLPAVENIQKGIKTIIKILHRRTCSHHRGQIKTWRGRKLDIRKKEVNTVEEEQEAAANTEDREAWRAKAHE